MADEIIPVLTIAGSDASGGAGIQADLKTFLAHGVYGMSAVTALTAQNTQGVRAIQEATPEFLAEELDAVFADIPPRAVKVGMVASAALIHIIAEKLRAYHAEHVVVDPVMVATSGAPLLSGDAMAALADELFPCAELLTPNLPELTRLTGIGIVSGAAMAAAAERAAQRFGTAVLAKGGHAAGDTAADLVFDAARPKSEHARHGVHAVFGHRGKPREGLHARGRRRPREGVSDRRDRLRSRSRAGTWAALAWLGAFGPIFCVNGRFAV